MTFLVTSNYKNNRVVVDGDRGYLAEFGKKRNTDHGLTTHYMWAENNNNKTAQRLWGQRSIVTN